jgi:hypothetical protein
MAPSSREDPPDGAATPNAGVARAARTNLLLSATIEAGALKAPVRIRNMSTSGALIDGAALPPVGATLVLRRLDLAIGATVMWQQPGRCGISFSGTISVQEWVAGVVKPAGAATAGQLRADALQSAIRQGLPIPQEEEAPPPIQSSLEDLDERLAQELRYVRRLFDDVGDELSNDPVILQRHAKMLQNFDVACRILDIVQAIVGAADREAAVGAVTMQDLRARLLRKRLF